MTPWTPHGLSFGSGLKILVLEFCFLLVCNALAPHWAWIVLVSLL